MSSQYISFERPFCRHHLFLAKRLLLGRIKMDLDSTQDLLYYQGSTIQDSSRTSLEQWNPGSTDEAYFGDVSKSHRYRRVTLIW